MSELASCMATDNHCCTVYRMDYGMTWQRQMNWCQLQCRSVAVN